MTTKRAVPRSTADPSGDPAASAAAPARAAQDPGAALKSRAAATAAAGAGKEEAPARAGRGRRARSEDAVATGSSQPLTLKDMVQGARTTARAVRFYEAQKLISAVSRSRGGHRLFDERELDKLRLVLEMRTCGFSIEEIREVLRAKARFGTVRESAQAIQKILTQHIAELRHKIVVIERLGREFSASIDVLDRCVHCTDPRGAGACSSCDVPIAASTPPSFSHIWSVPPRTKPA